jgi:hypothetical protein
MPKNIKLTHIFLERADFNMCFRELGKKDLIDATKLIAKDIVKYNCFEKIDFTDNIQKQVIDYFCEKEILFFEPSDTKVYPNSRIYYKAMELLVKQ